MKIQVVPYNPNWPEMFEVEAKKIKNALKGNCIAIHHIGSTSVPSHSAKPKIDIIAVVRDLFFHEVRLEAIGYRFRGGFNIPLQKCFRIITKDRQINLHVFEKNDPEIELNIMFRNYLCQNPNARDQYAALKYNLIKKESSHQKNNSIYSGYTLGKNAFIQTILKEIGCNKHRFVLCTHDNEWENYHRICKEQIFDPINIEYDINHPSITAQEHFHFALYKGTKIVTVAHIEFLNEIEAALRSLATDEIYQNNGFGKIMMNLLEKWLRLKGKKILKMHSRLSAESFYRKLRYVDIIFDDPCIQENYINLGKSL